MQFKSKLQVALSEHYYRLRTAYIQAAILQLQLMTSARSDGVQRKAPYSVGDSADVDKLAQDARRGAGRTQPIEFEPDRIVTTPNLYSICIPLGC